MQGEIVSFPIFRMFLSEKPAANSLLSAGRHLFLPRSEISETTDLSYGDHERHRLDIYEPAEITEIIVFVHGGGWETGSKEMHRFIGRSWARNDFIVVLPNYRLVPEAHYPDQVQDVVRALAWLQRNYEKSDGSLYLAGHSAGAHLASLVGFSKRWLSEAELETENIAGFILMAGVYQFYPYEKADERVKQFIGGRRYWEEAQPINYLDEDLSPVFIAHGSSDREVLPEQSFQLGEKLTKHDVKNELIVEEGAGHLELLLGTSRKCSNFWSSLLKFYSKID